MRRNLVLFSVATRWQKIAPFPGNQRDLSRPWFPGFWESSFLCLEQYRNCKWMSSAVLVRSCLFLNPPIPSPDVLLHLFPCAKGDALEPSLQRSSCELGCHAGTLAGEDVSLTATARGHCLSPGSS